MTEQHNPLIYTYCTGASEWLCVLFFSFYQHKFFICTDGLDVRIPAKFLSRRLVLTLSTFTILVLGLGSVWNSNEASTNHYHINLTTFYRHNLRETYEQKSNILKLTLWPKNWPSIEIIMTKELLAARRTANCHQEFLYTGITQDDHTKLPRKMMHKTHLSNSRPLDNSLALFI